MTLKIVINEMSGKHAEFFTLEAQRDLEAMQNGEVGVPFVFDYEFVKVLDEDE